MKCALISRANVVGGVWRHIVDLGRGLMALGMEISLYGPKGVVAELRESNSGLKIFDIDSEIDADVVHLHLGNSLEPRQHQLIEYFRGRATPVVVTEHLPRNLSTDSTIRLPGVYRKPGAGIYKRVRKRYELNGVSQIITVSQEDKSFMVARYGFPEWLITPISNQIDASADFSPLSSSSRFVSAGSIITQKGFDVLVEASRYRETEWTVDVYGDGPHRGQLIQRSLELGSAVKFLGHSSNVIQEMDSSRGVVIPSRWEGCPYVLLEAMSRARPVIASAVDSMTRIVRDADCGVLVSADDPEELARAIDSLSQTDESVRLGMNGRSVALEWSVESMATQVAAVYSRVLQKK